MNGALRRLLFLPFVLFAVFGSDHTFAQPYPSRPIRLVVGFPPGGGVDTIARLIGPRLAAQLGQKVVIDNRTGASGVLAGDFVAKAAPDGYTLLLGESGLLIAQHLQGRLPFDPVNGFTPVAGLFSLPLLARRSRRCLQLRRWAQRLPHMAQPPLS